MKIEKKYIDKEGLKTFLGLIKENFAAKTDVNKQKEFRFFNITVEGTVTVKFIVEGETIYEKSFTDTSVQIALPDNVTKFEEIVIEGEGKVTSCECPLIVNYPHEWIKNPNWKNTVFDLEDTALSNYLGEFKQEGCKFYNYHRCAVQPRPVPYTTFDITKMTSGWDGYFNYMYTDDTFSWGTFIEASNALLKTKGFGIILHGIIDETILDTDIDGIDENNVLTYGLKILDLDNNSLRYVNEGDPRKLKQIGWCNAEKCTSLSLPLPTLEKLLIVNLGCNLNVAQAHLSDYSINMLGKMAKTVSNKTITLSGYNFYRLTAAQRKYFADKGFNIAVNWDNDEMYKFMYEASNPTTLSSMIDDNNTSMTLTAEDGMWFTESDDDVNGRTFANTIITNDSNLWIQVTNEYKEEYEKKIKEEMAENLKEMKNTFENV